MNFNKLNSAWDSKQHEQKVQTHFLGLTQKEADGTITPSELDSLRTAQFVHAMLKNFQQINKYEQLILQNARRRLEKRQYEHYLRTLMQYLVAFVLVYMDKWVDERRLMVEITNNNDITENGTLLQKIGQRLFTVPIWGFQKKESVSASLKRMFRQIWDVSKKTRIHETVRPVIQWSSDDFPQSLVLAETDGGLDDAILNMYKQNCEQYEDSHFVGWPIVKTIKLVNAVYGLLVLLFMSLKQFNEYFYDENQKICLGFKNWGIMIVYVVSFWNHWCQCCFEKHPTFDLESVTKNPEISMDIIVMCLFMIVMQHDANEATSDKFSNYEEFKNHLYYISYFNTKSYVDKNSRIQFIQREEDWEALMWKKKKTSSKNKNEMNEG